MTLTAFLSDWLTSIFAAISRKPNAKAYEEHRSQALKAFLKLIHKKIYDKYEKISGDMQFVFKNSLNTRETLYCIQLFVQKCYDQ